jgi:predicted  nucleic acid-binding Zn-ribbon protein
MAEEARTQAQYRYIGIAVVAVALVGWLLAVYFWYQSSEATSELQRHQVVTGSTAEVETRLVALRSEAVEAESQTGQRLGELEEVTQRLEQASAEAQTLDQEVQALRDERETLEAELDSGRNELGDIEDGIEEARQQVAQVTQELADVGERIEDARRREAELQSDIAALSAELSELTEEAAEAEERVQEARAAEASLEQLVADARQELQDIETSQEALEQSVETLIARREDLADETRASEEQMGTLQQMVIDVSRTLAERADHLAALEADIAETQQRVGTPGRAEAAGITPGRRYLYGAVVATFNPDGTFHMTNMRTEDSVRGAYTLEDGVLTLSEAQGDLREVEFPMRCGITDRPSGFVLEDTDGSCSQLAGAGFGLDNR